MIDKKTDDGNVNNSSDAEILKIQSEIEKNCSESNKNNLEALIIKRRLGKRWYLADFAFKIIIGTIVTSALLATWWIAYLYPILTADNEISKKEVEKNKLQTAIDKNENTLEREKLEKENIILGKKNIILNSRIIFLEQNYKKLQQRDIGLAEGENELRTNQKNLENKYTKALENIRSSDYNSFKALENDLESETDKIKAENVKLNEKLRESRTQSQLIKQEIKIVTKINSNVHIYYKKHEEKAFEIKDKLYEAGYINTTNPFQADEVPNKTQVRYFRNKEKEQQEAQLISNELSSLGISAVVKYCEIPFYKRLFIEDRHYEIWIGKKLSQD